MQRTGARRGATQSVYGATVPLSGATDPHVLPLEVRGSCAYRGQTVTRICPYCDDGLA